MDENERKERWSDLLFMAKNCYEYERELDVEIADTINRLGILLVKLSENWPSLLLRQGEKIARHPADLLSLRTALEASRRQVSRREVYARFRDAIARATDNEETKRALWWLYPKTNYWEPNPPRTAAQPPPLIETVKLMEPK